MQNTSCTNIAILHYNGAQIWHKRTEMGRNCENRTKKSPAMTRGFDFSVIRIWFFFWSAFSRYFRNFPIEINFARFGVELRKIQIAGAARSAIAEPRTTRTLDNQLKSSSFWNSFSRRSGQLSQCDLHW